MTAETKTAETPAALLPPQEKFWRRYSPHGEAPLSVASSLALHLAVGGFLLLAGFFLLANFGSPRTTLPVESIGLDPGSGVGKRGGDGGKAGVESKLVEDPGGRDDAVNPLVAAEPVAVRPALNAIEVQQIKEKYDPADVRPITTTESGKRFARLDERIRNKLAEGLRRGTGGGDDGPRGKPGADPGPGGGKAKLDPRVRRMLRWHMAFTATGGQEYLKQLKDLGAILAFQAGGEKYQVVRDLRAGGKLLDENISDIKRIYWIDDKPKSVSDVLDALGVKLAAVPPRFIAFMPKELEDKLFEMEKNYVTRTLRVPFNEDKIDETHFRVVFKRGKFQPELVGVSMRK
jgi:hypothetical protein